RSVTTKTGITYTFSYDALGRRIGAHDPRHPAGADSITHYDPITGRVAYTLDPHGARTSFSYNATTGQLTSITDASNNRRTFYGYRLQGEVERVWGDTPQPVKLTYDDFGQRRTLSTYHGASNAGINWGDPNWPGDSATADTTTWDYDEPTGLLRQKIDAAGRSVGYLYYPDGKLFKRTWARGLDTTYTYAPATGELSNIAYQGGTPGVALTYKRFGALSSITDAIGTRTFGY